MNVLIVEDSLLLRERLAHSIGGIRGVKVMGYADTAQDAVREIQKKLPDAVVLDIRLREGSGFDVLQEVKAAPDPPIIIVLTNFAYPQYRSKYLKAGADYFFDKSNEFDQVLDVLEELVKKEKKAE